MFAVKGIYKGNTVTMREAVPVNEDYDVVITFLHPSKYDYTFENKDISTNNTEIQERVEMAKSLFGMLPSTASVSDIREERLKRYESNN